MDLLMDALGFFSDLLGTIIFFFGIYFVSDIIRDRTRNQGAREIKAGDLVLIDGEKFRVNSCTISRGSAWSLGDGHYTEIEAYFTTVKEN